MKNSYLRWLPAVLLMAIIFLASNTPGSSIPNFGTLDAVLKKAGHVSIYCLLAIAYWYGLRFERSRWWMALLLAFLYAVTDEFHQAFIPGRHSSWVDVTVFDGSGATLGLLLSALWMKKKTNEAGASPHSSSRTGGQ